MRPVVRVLLGAALVWTGYVAGHTDPQAQASPHPARIVVRWCPEDAVQWGLGDFDGTRWERYRCIARDDL
jgi:hypothetical protein